MTSAGARDTFRRGFRATCQRCTRRCGGERHGGADGRAVPRGAAQDEARDLGRRRADRRRHRASHAARRRRDAWPASSTASTHYADDCLIPDPETGEPINVSHMIPRSRDDLKRRHAGPRAAVGGHGGPHGPHARLHEHEVRRLRLAPAASGPAPTGATSAAPRNLVAFQQPPRPRRHLAHPHDHPADHRQARPTPGSSATRSPCTRSARPPTASSCAARASSPPSRRSPTRSRSIPGQPMPAGRRRHYAARLRHPARHAGPELPVPRQRRGAGRRSVRPAAVVPLRRAGRLLIFDDVRGAAGPRVHRRRRRRSTTRCAQTGYAINMTTQTTIRALTKLEFAYGLATRMAELIGDQSPATHGDAGRARLLRRGSPRNAVELSLEQAWERGRRRVVPRRRGRSRRCARCSPSWFPRVNEIITLIGSHNLLTDAEPRPARRRRRCGR